MKKFLLSTLIAATGFTAFADEGADATYAGSMLYGHCTTAATTLTFSSKVTAGEAMQLPQSVINELMGCRITAIAVANGRTTAGSQATEIPLTLFTSPDLAGEPDMTFTANMPLSPALAYTEYALPEPITITADMKPLYFGFYAECDPEVAMPLVVDGRSNDYAGEGDWFGVLENGKWDWQQLRNRYGFGCIRIKIEGSRLPGNNVSIIESHVPDYAAPGAEGRVEMYLQNEAGNEINSVEVTYSIGGATPRTATIDLPRPLLYNDYTVQPVGFTFTAPESAGGNIAVDFRVSGVNGNAANQSPADYCSGSGWLVSIPAGEGYKKNMVAEIATGTWCGYCPIGVVGVSKMLAAHPDGSFIPVAVHIGDAMAEMSYASLSEDFTGEGNAPMMVVNRNTGSFGVQNPSFDILKGIYGEVVKTPAVVLPKIEAVSFDPSKRLLAVDASAQFAISEAGTNYTFAYVITEDNVGPYTQQNYYSDELADANPALTLEGWDELPAEVDTTFNCVARMIRKFNGVANSIPSTVETGKTYTHRAELQTNSVTEIGNCSIIVMVVNRISRRIENAVSARLSDLASIGEISAPDAAGKDWFDLQGRRIASPSRPGVYISNGAKILITNH